VIPGEREVNSETATCFEVCIAANDLKKEKRMLTSLDVKAAVATEDTVAIFRNGLSAWKKAVSGRQQVATAMRRNHALD
jgi:hypothetical protein